MKTLCYRLDKKFLNHFKVAEIKKKKHLPKIKARQNVQFVMYDKLFMHKIS